MLTFVVALGSIIYSLSLTNYFTSESVLVSRDQQNSNPLSQLSGIASMAGIGGLTNSSSSSAEKVIEIIQSREFVKHLITFENILPSIMAPKSYNAISEELYFDPEIFKTSSICDLICLLFHVRTGPIDKSLKLLFFAKFLISDIS